ncbi:MAG: hypothetical protein JWN34_1883 [Bryobacterales bacterium]|nr:hypothetical protein [Bryobacterales bacterium]
MARRRFFVDQVRDGKARIEGENAQHLTRVLRVEAGQIFEISDSSRVWLAEIETARKALVEFNILEELPTGPELPQVTLYLAIIKFDKFEWAVEKATELGVAAIVPVEANRTDQGLFEGSKKRAERWRRIAREGSEQSRRLKAPLVTDPIRFAAALSGPAELRVWLDEQPGAKPLIEVAMASPPVSTALLIGPEGGWTPAERAQMDAAGWQGASLGPPVLRAETAVCAALAVILQAQHPAWSR